VEFRAAQPASLEVIPKQDRVHLPGEFIDAPGAAVADGLAGCVERQAVELAECVDLEPVDATADVTLTSQLYSGRTKPMEGHGESDDFEPAVRGRY
jgi:hypothetical protein